MLIFAFFLGLGLSVALNSLADSLPPDANGHLGKPSRPYCPECGRLRPLNEWLATLHWLTRRGQCAQCGTPRPIRHVIVEILTPIACMYAALWANGDPLNTLAALDLVAILGLITIIDIEHRLILTEVILPSALVAALIGFARGEDGPWYLTLAGGAAGYVIFLVMFGCGQVFSAVVAKLRGGQPLDEIAFGGGDVNLGLVIGLLVGYPAMLFAVLITILSGAAFSLVYLVVQVARRKYSMYTAIPYGPFLVLGGWIMFFNGPEFANGFCQVMQWSCYKP